MENRKTSPSEAAEFRSPLSYSMDSLPLSDDAIEENRDKRIKKMIAWQPGQKPPEGTIAKGNILIDTTTPEPPPAIETTKPSIPPEVSITNTNTITTIPDNLDPKAFQAYIDFAQGGPNPNFEPARTYNSATELYAQETTPGVLSRLKTRGDVFVQKLSPNRLRRSTNMPSGD